MTKVKQLKDSIVNFASSKQNLLLSFAILLLGSFWRLLDIAKIPGKASLSEVSIAKEALVTINNGWKLNPNLITNSLYLYLISIVGKLSRFNLLSLRLLQITIGFVTVYLFYLFLKNWFNRQTAMLGSLLFGANAFHIALSRQLNPNILLPLVFIIIFIFVTNAFRTNKNIWFILTGLTFGLGLYISNLFVITPILFVAGAIYYYFKNKKFIDAYFKGLLLGTIAFFVAAIPFIYYLPKNLFKILNYFNPGSIGGFYLNLGNLIQSLFYTSPSNYFYNVGTEPILDPFITVTFIVGVIYAIFNLRRKKFTFLVGWFVLILVLLAMQSKQDFSTILLLLPSIYALASFIMDYVLTKWVRTFPFNMVARLTMTFVFSLFLFMSIFYNYQKYFYAFSTSSETRNNFKYQLENNN